MSALGAGAVGATGAVVSGAVVTGAEVEGAEVSGTVVTGAEVEGAEVSGAVVAGADVAGVVIVGAGGLSVLHAVRQNNSPATTISSTRIFIPLLVFFFIDESPSFFVKNKLPIKNSPEKELLYKCAIKHPLTYRNSFSNTEGGQVSPAAH